MWFKKSTLPFLIAAVMLPVSGAVSAEGFWWSNKFQPVQVFSNFSEAQTRFKEQEAMLLEGGDNHGSYLRAGINLSDLACSAWLQSLGKSQRDTNLFKDLMNVAGNVILGVAGINGASSDSLARGSLLLAGGNAAIDTADNAIFFGVVGDVEEKLREGRSISAQVIRTNVPDNFDDAKSMLLAYHNSCSPGAIKNLLKAGLAQVEYVSPLNRLEVAISKATARTLIQRFTDDLYGPNSRFAVPEDDLYRLWVLEQVPNDDPSPTIQRMRSPQVIALQNQYRQAATPARVAQLNQLAAALGFRGRYEEEAKAEADSANERVSAADVEVEVAAEEVVKAAKKVGADDLKKVSPVLRDQIMDSRALSSAIDKASVEELKKSGERLEKSNKTNARNLGNKLKELASKAEEEQVTDVAITARIRAPRLPSSAYSERSQPASIPPTTINAILVPKKEIGRTR